MKKKKSVRLVLLIIIVIIAIILISKFFNNKEENIQRLSNIYEKLNTNQTYLFEMQRNEKNKVIMAKKGNKTLIDQYSENNHLTTIVKDSDSYVLLHNREEYYVFEQNNVEQNILTDGIGEVITKNFVTGTEKIQGKKYLYEEYPGSTIFIISSTLNVKEEDIKTRFFFDKDDNLIYIKTMTGNEQELLKVNLQNEVDDSIFEIPENYAEN